MVLGEKQFGLLELPAVVRGGLASGNPEQGAGHGSLGPQAMVRSLLRLPVVRRDAAKSRFYALPNSAYADNIGGRGVNGNSSKNKTKCEN